MAGKVFMLDNGAALIKAGFTTDEAPMVIPNCIMKAKSERTRAFIGNQVDDCRDMSGLYYILPFQKGYCINWDIQKTVWDYIVGKDVFNINFPNCTAIVTEPYFNFNSLEEAANEILFEEYEFPSILRINGGTLSAHAYQKDNPQELCCLVVDSGYSFTHIVPYVKCKMIKEAICRIDVGGKVLTNHLKEIISYRQLHVMDETYVVNQLKEDSCYVSQEFQTDLVEAGKKWPDNTIVRDYVLPDYTTIRRGYLRSHKESVGHPTQGEQIIRMNNERISLPELLFHPSDVGISQMGICEAIIYAINECPKIMHPHLYRNILLTGGNCNFAGFQERVQKDVTAMAPEMFNVKVTLGKEPLLYSWHGGKLIEKHSDFQKMCITKEQYEEYGHSWVNSKFYP